MEDEPLGAVAKFRAGKAKTSHEYTAIVAKEKAARARMAKLAQDSREASVKAASRKRAEVEARAEQKRREREAKKSERKRISQEVIDTKTSSFSKYP